MTKKPRAILMNSLFESHDSCASMHLTGASFLVLSQFSAVAVDGTNVADLKNTMFHMSLILTAEWAKSCLSTSRNIIGSLATMKKPRGVPACRECFKSFSTKCRGALLTTRFTVKQEIFVSEKFRQKRPSGSSSGIYFRQTSVVARCSLVVRSCEKN